MSPPKFNDWGLEGHIADAIDSMGWDEPTEIQLEAIPVARAGTDIVGQARTGSGKQELFWDSHNGSCKPLARLRLVLALQGS